MSASTQREPDLVILAAGGETGWWDQHRDPAPWPDDFPDTLDDPDTDWRPATNPPPTLAPGEHPF